MIGMLTRDTDHTAHQFLPQLSAQRSTRRLSHWLAGRLPGAHARRLQVTSFAAGWAAENAIALGGDGPLWVALGDSSAQGIGASHRLQGYVGQLLHQLRKEDPAWRVVNISSSGARVAHVLDRQLPGLAALEPSLTTCTVGANDLVPTRLTALLVGMEELMERLPAGAVVATLPLGLRPGKAQAINTLVTTLAPQNGLVVADVCGHTGPPWRYKLSSDWFHPNELGYRDWCDAFVEALRLPTQTGIGPDPVGRKPR